VYFRNPTNRHLPAAGLHPLVEKHGTVIQTLIEICRMRGFASLVNAYLQPLMFPRIYVMYSGVQQQNAI
jgi:isopenicillin N synthase-like dioxygenase